MNKIFNIGLPRSGTSSLHEALLSLGYRSLHNPLDLRIISYEKGIYRYDRDDWDAITNFGEHFYPQLDQNYPNSKFILTCRPKDVWMESAKRWFSRPPYYPPRDNKARLETFGCITFNEDRFSYVYDSHFEGVMNYFKNREHDLLVLRIGEENPWLSLCDFLNRPIPSSPFPYKNSHATANSFHNGLRHRVRAWIKYYGK